MGINKNKTKKDLIEAIKEFGLFGSQLLKKGNKPYLAINTTVNDTKTQLISLLLYIDGKNVYYISSFHEEFFISQLRATYRYFLFTIQIAIQAGLNDLINERKIPIVNNRANKINELIKSLRKSCGKDISKKQDHDLESLVPRFYQFNDYLDSVLNNLSLPTGFPKQSRNFLTALSLARNKSSHFNDEEVLTKSEIEILSKGKLGKLIGKDNMLVMDIQYLAPILRDVVKVFNVLIKATTLSNSDTDRVKI